MNTMTVRQKQAYDFIKSFVDKNGYGPSYQEIAEGIGLRSKSGINRIICDLNERGLIKKVPGRHRCFSFVGEAA